MRQVGSCLWLAQGGSLRGPGTASRGGGRAWLQAGLGRRLIGLACRGQAQGPQGRLPVHMLLLLLLLGLMCLPGLSELTAEGLGLCGRGWPMLWWTCRGGRCPLARLEASLAPLRLPQELL